MAYQSPVITASGISFATFQQSGVSGHLELLISAQAATLDPTGAPTLTESGSGGTLPAATYYCVFTELSGIGETLPSPVSGSQVITLGEDLVVGSFPSLQTGNHSRNIYISSIGSTGPFYLAATATSASSVTFSAPLPSSSFGMVQPPKANGTALSGAKLAMLRSCKDGNLADVYRTLRTALGEFNSGEPMPFTPVGGRAHDAHVVFAMLGTLCAEALALVDGNPGTISNKTTGIGASAPRRTWP